MALQRRPVCYWPDPAAVLRRGAALAAPWVLPHVTREHPGGEVLGGRGVGEPSAPHGGKRRHPPARPYASRNKDRASPAWRLRGEIGRRWQSAVDGGGSDVGYPGAGIGVVGRLILLELARPAQAREFFHVVATVQAHPLDTLAVPGK